jgi:uncharacterized protein YdaU (DUF1376 family)
MKAYSFYFNASDWLASASVKQMSLAERGAYIGLLAFAWGEKEPGTLPASADKVRRLAEMSPAEWEVSSEAILEKFPLSECGTYRYNPRLIAEAKKQQELSEKNAENGRKSAERRAAEKAAKEAAAAEAQRKANEMSTTVAPNPTTVDFRANEMSTKLSQAKQSTNVDEEREASSASVLKKEVGGQPLNAQPTAPTIVAVPAAADPAKAAAIATTDYDDEQPWQESPLTKPEPFRIICDRVELYRGIAYEHYRQLALAAVEGTDTRRTVKQWQSWIHKFLANQTPKNGKLLTGAEVADQARTGVHAPQYEGGYRHEVRPELQAQREAEQQAQIQARIAANFARTAAAQGQVTTPLPGGVARSF